MQAQATRANYATGACPWRVGPTLLKAIVAGTKRLEGRPNSGKYATIQMGDYRNLGCPFYWVVVHIAKITIFDTLTEMVEACGFSNMIPGSQSTESCVESYLSFTGMAQYKHSQWMAFSLDVLEYKLGNFALQFAVCQCSATFASIPPTASRSRLQAPARLQCAKCIQL